MFYGQFHICVSYVHCKASYPHAVCALPSPANVLLRIICLFLTFLAVCDAVLPPMRFIPDLLQWEEVTVLINCKTRVTHRPEWFVLLHFCQMIWENLQTHTVAIKGRFFCQPLCPSESKPHFGGISPHPFCRMTVVKRHPTFHCASIYYRTINTTRLLLKGSFTPPKGELIRESLVLEASVL